MPTLIDITKPTAFAETKGRRLWVGAYDSWPEAEMAALKAFEKISAIDPHAGTYVADKGQMGFHGKLSLSG